MAMGRQTDGVLTAGRAACDICCTHEAATAAAAAAAAAADAGDVAATVIHAIQLSGSPVIMSRETTPTQLTFADYIDHSNGGEMSHRCCMTPLLRSIGCVRPARRLDESIVRECRAHAPLQSAPSVGDLDPYPTHGSLRPHESAVKRQLDCFSHFVGLDGVSITHRQTTERAICVAIGRIACGLIMSFVVKV